ncbi:hypothetical protein LXA43DRAFT_1057813 [Ganoderma leucocontextum]|nr:hypothetical protein LXA43DRAFT_1057813 [Ganoderma leucocontextum]
MTHEDVLASLTQGQPVNLPGREPNLPIFWRFETHKLLEGVKGVKEVFIGAVDPRMEALLHSYFAAESRAFSDGTDKAVEAAGFLKLFPRSYVFLRDLNGDGNPMKDKLIVWVAPLDALSPGDGDALLDARDQILGPRAERTSHKAVKIDGKYVGGVKYECSDSALNVANSDRCFTAAVSYQAAAPAAIAALETGTRAAALALQTLTIWIIEGSFQRDLGQFAGKHIDANDSPGGTTCMITVNDLADDDQPGYFMIVQKGLVRSCFNGLFHHGGFPPTAPVGVHPQPWSYRCVIVCYPPRAMLDGDCNISYASLPRSHYRIAPEMIRPSPLISQASQDTMVPSTNCTSWLTEGPRLTTRDTYLQWFYQTQCQQLAFFARQAPPEVALEVDYNLLAQCFSLVDETGQKIQPHSWDLRPGSTHISPVLGCSRQETTQLWHDHNEDQGKFIPYCALLRADKSLVSSVKAEYFSDTQPSESGSANEDVRTSESDAPDAPIGCDHPKQHTCLLRRRSQRSSLRTSDTELSESSTSSGQQEPRAQTPKRSHKKVSHWSTDRRANSHRPGEVFDRESATSSWFAIL